jgi:carbamoyltransferase
MVRLRAIFAREFGVVPRVHYVDHHLAHAASAYYPSPWDEALILSLDGTGEWVTTLLARGRGSSIEPLAVTTYPHSLGVLYGAATQFLGYRVYRDEWKVMGLAAYGRPRYAEKVRRLVQASENGTFRLDLDYFNFQYADKKTWYSPRFETLFGPARRPHEPVESERFADLAASFQLVTEEIVLGLVRRLLELGGGTRRLCLAGGVALNAAANGRILADAGVEALFVQPAAHDSGAGLGAALFLHHRLNPARRTAPLCSAALGPEYGETEARRALDSAGIAYEKCDDVAARCARHLDEGRIVGWFQGRMEYGPRALGHRSILADPRRAEMKETLNARVKDRERFRPFAPSVLAERASEFFAAPGSFPFMTTVLPVRPAKRAVVPAVVHADGTARLQTVEKDANPKFYELIREFDRIAGVPMLLNTSFNVRGEPIVCTPEDAVRTFQTSGLDVLVLGDLLAVKGGERA